MDIEKELKIKNLYEKDTKISEILQICKCSSATVNKVREKYNLNIYETTINDLYNKTINKLK